jgi:hypothetical protein
MKRRPFVAGLLGAAAWLALPEAIAHHGWGGWNLAEPVYLEGIIKTVRWQNPHPELVIEVSPDLALPAGLSTRPLPQELEQLGRRDVLTKASLPKDPAGAWIVETTGILRLENFGLKSPPKAGEKLATVGYLNPEEPRRLRPDMLFLEDGRVIRSK